MEKFKIDGVIHEKDNKKCGACWSSYPRRCVCGGLIHAAFGDYVNEGYFLYEECDKCGYNFEEAESIEK